MAVVQDPKAEVQDRLAGLELLRCLLVFDDKAAITRRLGLATLLRRWPLFLFLKKGVIQIPYSVARNCLIIMRCLRVGALS